MNTRITPFSPIFDPEKKTGGIKTGTTPFGLGQVEIGGVASLAIGPTHAFVGISSLNAVKAIDITSLATPTVVDTLTDGTDLLTPSAVELSGDYLYVACGGDRLTVVDVSDPTAMSVAGTITDGTDLDTPLDVKVDGTLAYVVAFTGRLTVVDITTPGSMSISSSTADASYNQARQVALDGDYAYMISSTGTGPLTVFDITATPSEDGQTADSDLSTHTRITKAGDYTYTAGSFGRWLTVTDVSDPTTPSVAIAYSDASLLSANDVVIRGSTAYVSMSNSGAAVDPQTISRFDISSPATASFVDTIGFTDVEDIYQFGFVGGVLLATAHLRSGPDVLIALGPF